MDKKYDWEGEYDEVVKCNDGFGVNQYTDCHDGPKKDFRELSSFGCSIKIIDYENIEVILPEDAWLSVAALQYLLTKMPSPTCVSTSGNRVMNFSWS